MKRLLMLFLMVGLMACNKDDSSPDVLQGEVSFAIDTQSQQGRVGESEAAAVLVSMEDADGHSVMELERIELIAIGAGLVSETITLAAGTYLVTDFIVVDAASKATYIAPLSGSEKAAFVTHPLPVSVTVASDATTDASIEVLEVTPDSEPEDFGYVSFPVDLIDRLELSISFTSEGAPVSGTLVAEGIKDGQQKWVKEFSIDGSADIHLYKGVDMISFIARSSGEQQKVYTLEELEAAPSVLFDFGGNQQHFVLEVAGLDRSVEHAIITLHNEEGLHHGSVEMDPTAGKVFANFTQVPVGAYELSIAILEENKFDEDLIYSVHEGAESVTEIEIVDGQQRVLVQGPDLPVDGPNHEGLWSERFFHRYVELAAVQGDLVWSTPDDPCGFDFHFLPVTLSRNPLNIYVDYFFSEHPEGVGGLVILECYTNCQPFELMVDFSDQLIAADGPSLCESRDWGFSDSIMFIDFGGDDFLLFYMQWDTEGGSLSPTESMSVASPSRMQRRRPSRMRIR